MNDLEIEPSFNIIIIGNSGVGKTSILQRYILNEFYENTLSTIGLNSTEKEITLKNGKKIKLKLFDTAGQEKYHSLSRSYFRNVDGVLFVYSVNDLKSFENIKDWIKLFMKNHNGKKDIPLYLIENKNDLDRNVEEHLIDDFLNEYNFEFKSTSAKLNDGNTINELFEELSELLYKNYNISGKQQNIIQLKPCVGRKPRSCFLCDADKI